MEIGGEPSGRGVKRRAARKPPGPEPEARSKKSDRRAEGFEDRFRRDASSLARQAAARIASPEASMERIRTLPLPLPAPAQGEKRNLDSRMEKISKESLSTLKTGSINTARREMLRRLIGGNRGNEVLLLGD